MAYATTPLAGIDFSTVDTTQEFPLGTIVSASDGAEYMYILADEAIAQYAAVKIDDDIQVSELTTTLSGAEPTQVGIAQIAFADTEYGWIVISGPCTVLAASSCAADVKCYTTATAGVIDDTATDLIQGLKLTTTNGASQAATAAFAAGRMYTNAQD